jgi:hypothetical protein
MVCLLNDLLISAVGSFNIAFAIVASNEQDAGNDSFAAMYLVAVVSDYYTSSIELMMFFTKS